MRKKSFDDMQCPVARTLNVVGEWWSMLILRDALAGLSRFDEFEESLKIAPNMLSTRLSKLVEAKLLLRRQYCSHPPRYEYVPTDRARDFSSVLWSLLAWGNKYCAPEGPAMQIANIKTGTIADPVLVDRISGKPLLEGEFQIIAGPAANDTIKGRVALMQSRGIKNAPQTEANQSVRRTRSSPNRTKRSSR